jgi:hypothetical protein
MISELPINKLPEGYEVCGIGAAPEEDSLVVMSAEAINELKTKIEKPGFFSKLFSGPYELSGTGSNSMESDFVVQELVERGIRR